MKPIEVIYNGDHYVWIDTDNTSAILVGQDGKVVLADIDIHDITVVRPSVLFNQVDPPRETLGMPR